MAGLLPYLIIVGFGLAMGIACHLGRCKLDPSEWDD